MKTKMPHPGPSPQSELLYWQVPTVLATTRAGAENAALEMLNAKEVMYWKIREELYIVVAKYDMRRRV